MIIKNKAFTLVEIMIWILIVSTIIISWFQAYIQIWYWKINLVEKSNIQRDSFYFTEKLFQLIKEWWTLDYEEYFNRKVVWTSISNWHYDLATWFWNFWKDWNLVTNNYWEWFYYCRSLSNTNYLSNQWCFNNNLSSDISWSSFWASSWDYQRYWQYSFQFIDYNSNRDNDFWDENWDWRIIRDDDDEVLWEWPNVFSDWSDVKELYLIWENWTKRTIIRWNILDDPNAPISANCDASSTSNFSNINLEWCRWVIEFLKLDWVDLWMDHQDNTSDSDGSEFDWVVDTWFYDRQFTWWTDVIATSWEWYWKELFPQTVSVTDFKIYAYPNISPEDSWKDNSPSSKISPYIVLSFKIKPSWEVRTRLGTEGEEIDFTTTVNLTDIYSN